MRIQHARPIPRSFSGHPKARHLVIAEADLRPSPRARLRAKLVVVRSGRDLGRFWTQVLGRGGLGRHCYGVVSALGRSAEKVDDQGRSYDRRWICDPRYFCIIGLCATHLSMEVISHEAVHAGFCYARRRAKDPWNDDRELGEEHVCYPAGAIAAEINRFLYKSGLYR